MFYDIAVGIFSVFLRHRDEFGTVAVCVGQNRETCYLLCRESWQIFGNLLTGPRSSRNTGCNCASVSGVCDYAIAFSFNEYKR